MSFIPETPKNKSAKGVPFFEDTTSSGGWQGQTTTKTIETLKSEVMACIGRLGGMVTAIQKGNFDDRQGFRVKYVVESPNGAFIPGHIDVAALPVRPQPWNSLEKMREKSLRMALYMLRIALDGTWFLQQLSPGYSALMPFMLMDGEKPSAKCGAKVRLLPNFFPQRKANSRKELSRTSNDKNPRPVI